CGTEHDMVSQLHRPPHCQASASMTSFQRGTGATANDFVADAIVEHVRLRVRFRKHLIAVWRTALWN
ncbi:MAG: hypothetical protein ACJ8E5_06440, partial [Xanthobacteraceae bacterium]